MTNLWPDEPKRKGCDSDADLEYKRSTEMWWEELPFLERIDRAADLGFPAIEFWDWRGKDIDAIAGKVQNRGLQVSNLTCWGVTAQPVP